MALAEGAALGVLAGQADRRAVGQDARRRPASRRGPSRCRPASSSASRRRASSRSSLAFGVKPVGTRQQRLVAARAARLGRRPPWRRSPARGDSAASSACSVRDVAREQVFAGLLQALLRGASDIASASARRRPRRRASSVCGVACAHRRMLGDAGVQQRLGERRLVALVVAPAPVADQVDQEILVEALAVGVGQSRSRRGRPPGRRR